MDGDRLRKAAILIDTLDSRRADELLAQMPPTQRVLIRHMVEDLGEVDVAEREAIIAEFLRPKSSRTQNAEQTDEAELQQFSKQETPYSDAIDDAEDDVTFEPSQALQMMADQTATATQQRQPVDQRDVEQWLSPNQVRHSEWNEPAEVSSLGTNLAKSATLPQYASSAHFQSTQTFAHQGTVAQRNSIVGDPSFVPYEGSHSQPAAKRATPSSPNQTNLRANNEAAFAPFEFLGSVDVSQIVRCLEFENPQAVAIVISYMKSELAVETIRQFAPQVQAEVLRRLTALEEVHPQVLDDLAEHIRTHLLGDEDLTRGVATHAGLQSLKAILEAVEESERWSMLEHLAQEEPALARHFRRQFFPNGFQPSDDFSSPLASRQNASDPAAISSSPFEMPQTEMTMVSEMATADSADDELSATQGFQNGSWQEKNSGLDLMVGDDWEEVGANPIEPMAENFASLESRRDPASIAAGQLADRDDTSNSDDSQQSERTEVERDLAASSPDSMDAGDTSSFEQVVELSQKKLAELIRQTDVHLLLAALAGAEEVIVDKILGHLPKREARAVREQIRQIGPIRLEDIEYAQAKIGAQVVQLQQDKPQKHWLSRLWS